MFTVNENANESVALDSQLPSLSLNSSGPGTRLSGSWSPSNQIGLSSPPISSLPLSSLGNCTIWWYFCISNVRLGGYFLFLVIFGRVFFHFLLYLRVGTFSLFGTSSGISWYTLWYKFAALDRCTKRLDFDVSAEHLVENWKPAGWVQTLGHLFFQHPRTPDVY